MRISSAVALAILSFTLGSCLSVPPKFPRPEPLAVLDPKALAFARVEGPLIGVLAPLLLPDPSSSKLVGKDLADLVARTRVAAYALLPSPQGESTRAGTTSRGEGNHPLEAPASPPLPRFEAALEGDFSPFTFDLSLGMDRSWKREGRAWRLSTGPLRGIGIAVPGQGRLLAASVGMAGLLAREEKGAVDPLPPRLSGVRGRGFLVWMPDPLHRILAYLDRGSGLFAEMSLPLDGILMTGDLVDPDLAKAGGKAGREVGDPELETELIVLMRDEESARRYLPAVKIAFTLFERSLRIEGTIDGRAGFARNGDSIRISGLRLRASALASLLASR